MTAPPDTPVEKAKEAISRVRAKAAEWAALPPAKRRALFEECQNQLETLKAELEEKACTARGYDPTCAEQAHLIADAAIASVVVTGAWLQGAVELCNALEKGNPPPPAGVVQRPDGTSRVKLTSGVFDYLLLDGASLQLSVDGQPTQFNPLESPPSLTGVLGAGNTEIPNDIIDSLLKLNSVVVYKVNPVLAVSNTIKERILQPLIDRGYVAFIYGGLEQGQVLTQSPEVDRIVVTGSCLTADRIVWGSGDKKDPSTKPVLEKPICAELGSVNPYMIVPGERDWSSSDLETQAGALVAIKLGNAGHICASPQVVITCRSWPQRRAFLDELVRQLSNAPPCHTFYPGTAQQQKRHLEAMGSKARVFEPKNVPAPNDAYLPLIFQEDLPPTDAAGETSFGLRNEAFGPVLYEVALDCPPDLPSFLSAATAFCKERLWGNLTCNIVVDESTRKNHEEAFETALDQMTFGTIGVNIHSATANAFPRMTWGAFPGNSLRDIGSGVGHFGSLSCYNNVQKSIMVAKFGNKHTPVLPVTLRQKQQELLRARRLSDLFQKPSWWRLTKVGCAMYTGL